MKHFKRNLVVRLTEELILRKDRGLPLRNFTHFSNNNEDDLSVKEVFFSVAKEMHRRQQYDGPLELRVLTDNLNFDLRNHCLLNYTTTSINDHDYFEGRKNFIYECNAVLNKALNQINFKSNMIDLTKQESYLLAFLFSVIAITKEKDLTNPNMSEEFISSFLKSDARKINVAQIGHTLSISTISLEENKTYENFFSRHGIDLNEWDITINGKCITDNDDLITKTKGYSIVTCRNKKDQNLFFSFRIVCGDIRENTSQYMLDQIRNIVAHGLFVLDEGKTKEYASRKVFIKNNNQLNLAFAGQNYFLMEYFPYVVSNLYSDYDRENIIYNLETSNNFVPNKEVFIHLIMLSKIYVNFIYNLDFSDRLNFDYSSILPLSIADLTEYINFLRTSIMHGWYEERIIGENKGIQFYCYRRQNSEELVFNTFLSYEEIEEMCNLKETCLINDSNY